jgi:hypothetical protein
VASPAITERAEKSDISALVMMVNAPEIEFERKVKIWISVMFLDERPSGRK